MAAGPVQPPASRSEAELLRERWHGLQLETAHGYFDLAAGSHEAETILARIREYRPHILCVGMGMPRQEHWIARYGGSSGANVVLSVGALMDLLAGELRTPPRWIGRAGLEWLFRLVSTPRRVWYRYLVEPWWLLPHLARDVARRRKKRLQRGR